MENQKFILLVALVLVIFLLWNAWEEDYGIKRVAPNIAEVLDTKPDLRRNLDDNDLPRIQDIGPGILSKTSTLNENGYQDSKKIRVITDVLNVEISEIGGDIIKYDLLDYPLNLKEKNKPIGILTSNFENLFVAQSGLLSHNPETPGDKALFKFKESEYAIGDDNTLEVSLFWENSDLISVKKTYIFHRGEYLVDVIHTVENKKLENWKGSQYRQLKRRNKEDENASMLIYTYTGGVLYSEEEKYEKITFDDMENRDTKLSRNTKNGWASIIQHYFLSAWIPEREEINHYYSIAVPGEKYILGLSSPAKVANKGETIEFRSKLYVGPKIQGKLENIATGLELTVDYGVLTILAKPLFWLLEKMYSFFGNWGLAIILVTFLIKLFFYKLSEASYKSMANMRRLQPRLQAMKERFGDDRQKLNQAMMELYKKEKINPLGGCLPVVIQIPVFIALYWVLLESVELRQAPFIFWINDLSSADPFFVLPLLMGITMFIQQKLNPAPIDPIQQKVMMVLPVMFTVFFAFFPSGLVLYWVVNNTLSIIQQWFITKRIAGDVKF